jgi:GDP-L-fucose synthase
MTATLLFPLAGKRVWVAGHRGMVGAALLRRLRSEDCEILTVNRSALDLRRPADVETWMAANRPDAVFLAAAKVGGIMANDTYPAEFLYDNLAIELNVIEAARRHGVGKLLFLGSACIYPKLAPQPIHEDSLLTGPLEPTNQWYAIAKIAGLKLGQAYRRQHGWDCISAMPANLYGPEDNFDPVNSHVMPALMQRLHEAKVAGADSVTIWGSGTPRREFLHVDDCADALVYLMQHYSDADPVNVGAGSDINILELTGLMAGIIGFKGNILTDPSKPDGTPARLMSMEKIAALGWRPQISLNHGIAATYRWYLENRARLRGANSH